MKTAKKNVRKPRSIQSPRRAAAIEKLQLAKSSPPPSTECASAPFNSSIEARATEPTSIDVLTLAEAAVLLRCHPKTLRMQAAAGKVPGKRIGSLWRFYRPALEKWLRDAT